MKIKVYGCSNGVQQTKLSLQKLVDHLIVPLEPTANRQKSFIRNDVPVDFLVNADEQVLASAMNSLFSSVICRSQNGSIRISAKTFNDIVLVHVEDQNNVANVPSSTELEEARPLAEKLGGCITTNDQRNNGTQVTLSFFSPGIAA